MGLETVAVLDVAPRDDGASMTMQGLPSMADTCLLWLPFTHAGYG